MSVACAVLTILSLPYMYMYAHVSCSIPSRERWRILPCSSGWMLDTQKSILWVCWAQIHVYACMYSAFSSSHSRLSLSFGCAWCLGKWEILTYGLFGMYKSDWLEHGGFNVQRYTNKWGGEDWDVLDRYVSCPLCSLFLYCTVSSILYTVSGFNMLHNY